MKRILGLVCLVALLVPLLFSGTAQAQDENCGIPGVANITASSCVQVRNEPGCDSPCVENCACFFDGYCCDVEWDSLCANAIIFDSYKCVEDCSGNITCQNGGSCVVDEGNATCTCPSTTQGFQCENLLDECTAQGVIDILNTTCLTARDEPGCSNACIESCVCFFEPRCCTEAWSVDCLDVASDCADFCQNNLTCNFGGACQYANSPGGVIATCDCPEGRAEPDCSSKLCDTCHHGFCYIPGCLCEPEWAGPTCDTPICSTPCSLNETCIAPAVCQDIGCTKDTCAQSIVDIGQTQNGNGVCSSDNTVYVEGNATYYFQDQLPPNSFLTGITYTYIKPNCVDNAFTVDIYVGAVASNALVGSINNEGGCAQTCEAGAVQDEQGYGAVGNFWPNYNYGGSNAVHFIVNGTGFLTSSPLIFLHYTTCTTCQNGGVCLPDFTCNCDGTGYLGDTCEEIPPTTSSSEETSASSDGSSTASSSTTTANDSEVSDATIVFASSLVLFCAVLLSF